MPARCRSVAALIAVAALLMALAAPALASGSDPLRDRQWHLDAVSATQAWPASSGEGVTVAVVDTGVDADHPDLDGQVLNGYDATDPGSSADDENGHGTLVAGVIAAIAGNDEGGRGTASAASILPVRVLDADGRGRPADVAEGIRWATDRGADVINLSLVESSGSAGDLLDGVGLVDRDVEKAIREAHEAGAVVVGAAGNDGDDEVPYSRDLPLAVVGAADRDGQRWHRSNADADTLFAPGVDIVSTWSNGRYAQSSGTSFAAPIVAAGAAMLLDVGVDHDDVVSHLRRHARPMPHSGGVDVVDLAGALEAAGGEVGSSANAGREADERSQEAASGEPAEPTAQTGSDDNSPSDQDDAEAGQATDEPDRPEPGEADDGADPTPTNQSDDDAAAGAGDERPPGDGDGADGEDVAAGDRLTVGDDGGGLPAGPVVIAWTVFGAVVTGHVVFSLRLFD